MTFLHDSPGRKYFVKCYELTLHIDCYVAGSTGSSPGKSSSSKKHKSGTNGSQRFWPANLSKVNSDNNEGELVETLFIAGTVSVKSSIIDYFLKKYFNLMGNCEKCGNNVFFFFCLSETWCFFPNINIANWPCNSSFWLFCSQVNKMKI